MNILDADEATNSLRQAINDNIRASAQRQHLISKGYLDPRTLEKADEEKHPERGEQWEEQRAYRESLKAAPVTGEDFAAFVEQVNAKFEQAAQLIGDLQTRVETLEKCAWKVEDLEVSIPTKDEKPKRGKAKSQVEEV